MPKEEPIACELCDRPFVRSQLTEHHCLPREKGGHSDHVALLCVQCHGMVHATFTNQTLAVMYPTIAKLREAPDLTGYLKWVRRQPSSRRKRNKPRRKKL